MAWIELEGAVNARDVGGLPTVDGRTTRSGVLLRSDSLQGLTESDVATLVDGLGVGTVVDLRTTGEVHLEGPGPLVGAGVRHVHLSLIPESGEDDEEQVEDAVQGRAIPARPQRERDSPTDMTGHYTGYVEEAGPNLAEVLRLLADAGTGTALVHCAAGKDRTGVVVALALSLAGVTREAVVADYVRSAERIEAIAARLKGSPTYGPSLEGVDAGLMTPVADSMERFLDGIDRDYGGPHGLALSLGVDEETVRRLATRLVGTSPLAR